VPYPLGHLSEALLAFLSVGNRRTLSRSPKFGEMLRQLEPKRDRNSVAIYSFPIGSWRRWKFVALVRENEMRAELSFRQPIKFHSNKQLLTCKETHQNNRVKAQPIPTSLSIRSTPVCFTPSGHGRLPETRENWRRYRNASHRLTTSLRVC